MNYIPLVDTTQLGFIPNVRIRAYRFDNHSVPVPFFDNASGDSPVGYELVSDSEGRISVPGSGVSDSVLLCTHEPAHIVCTDSESGVVRRTFDVSTANIGVVFNDASVKVIVQNHSKLTDGLAQTLQENDYVKVIKDETHGNGISYYYLAEPSSGEYDWIYVGTENDLSNVLDDEIEARQQGDAELSSEIQAVDSALLEERQARVARDTEERNARVLADLNLQGQIAQKIGDAPNDDKPYIRQNGSWHVYAPTTIFTADDAETILAAVNAGGELVLAEHIEDGGAYDFKRYAAVSTEVGEGANSYTIKFSRTEGDTIYTKTMTLDTVTPSVSWESETVANDIGIVNANPSGQAMLQKNGSNVGMPIPSQMLTSSNNGKAVGISVQNNVPTLVPLEVGGGGSGGISTLFKTVADMQAASLNVGDVVETAGFYSVNDGGGAKYQIQSTGTANGMDLIAVAGGKIAKVLLKQSGYPEQIGYKLNPKTSAMDLSLYIDKLASIGCRKILLHGNGSQPYYMLTPFSTNRPDIHIIGALSLSSGYATRIYFVPDETSTLEQAMFTFSTRCNSIEHCILRCDTTDTDLNTIGVKYSCPTVTDSFGNQLHDCAIQQFGTGISFAEGGTSGEDSAFNWHMSFSHLLMDSYKMNLYLNGLFHCVKFYNCLFSASNSAQYNVLTECSSFTAEFECCNFGILMPQDTLFKINPWINESAPVNERSNIFTFNSCRFVFEEANGLPSNVSGLLFNVENWMINELIFNGCTFIVTPLARHDIFSCTMIKLGSNTRARFVGCKGPFEDVDYTGNYFLEKDFDKLMIDRNSPPKKEVGSLHIAQSFGFGYTDFGSSHLPCTIVDDQLPLVDNSTDFIREFKFAKDGQQLFNIDTGRVVVKVGDGLVNVSEEPQNIIRIGNEVYNYVVINGLKWITRNLNLRTYNRNYQYWNHPEWGQYYKNSDFDVISEMLPNGWRIPTTSDINSLVGDGSATRARSLQKLGYSVWGNATNSTGFNADPSLRWYRPSQVPSQTFNRAILWGNKISSGTEAIILAENSISKGGWNETTAAGLMVPLRVCADA